MQFSAGCAGWDWGIKKAPRLVERGAFENKYSLIVTIKIYRILFA